MDEFKPIEKKIQFKIFSKRKEFLTQIFYQRGYQDGKCALRFFFTDKIVTKVHAFQKSWEFDKLGFYDKLWLLNKDSFLKSFGAQTEIQAEQQRERTLEKIVEEVIKSFNY